MAGDKNFPTADATPTSADVTSSPMSDPAAPAETAATLDAAQPVDAQPVDAQPAAAPDAQPTPSATGDQAAVQPAETAAIDAQPEPAATPTPSASDAAETAAPVNPPEAGNEPRPMDGADTMTTASGQTPTNDTMAVDPASAPLAPNAGTDVAAPVPGLDEQGAPAPGGTGDELSLDPNRPQDNEGPTRPQETTGDTVNADVAAPSPAAVSAAQATSDDGSAIIGTMPALTNTQIEAARSQAEAAARPVITPESPASAVNVDVTNPDAPAQRSVYAMFDEEIPAYFHAREDRDHFKSGDQVRVYQPPALDPYPALVLTDEDEHGFIIVDRGPSDGQRTVNANIVRIEKL